MSGKELRLELRDAAGKNERLAELAAELVRAKVPRRVHHQLRLRCKPQVGSLLFSGSAHDRVQRGILASLAHPGGNVTGMALIADHAKPLALLEEAVPRSLPLSLSTTRRFVRGLTGRLRFGHSRGTGAASRGCHAWAWAAG